MSKKTEYKLKNEQYMLDLQNKDGIHKLLKGILYEVLDAGSGSQHPVGHRDRYLDSLFRVDEPVPRDLKWSQPYT